MKLLDPVHPGEVLLEDFMKPLDLSINRLARDLHVPPNRIAAIVKGTRAISADTAFRLSRYFQTTPNLWMNLQVHYELRIARRKLEPMIKREVRPLKRPPQAA